MKNYNTKQKEILISFFKNNHNKQFTANDISMVICNDNIGKSTVYRLIKQLSKEGTIRCFYNNDKKVSMYQYVENSPECNCHFHLKCNKCNKIIHLECDHTAELRQHISNAHKFNVDMTKTILYGYCESCNKEEGLL